MIGKNQNMQANLNPELLVYLSRLKGSILYEFLQSVWFGDLACSGGEHYVRGFPLQFQQIISRRAQPFSDDLILSIATSKLATEILEKDPDAYEPSNKSSILQIKKEFIRLVEPYFWGNEEQYGPNFPKLMEAETFVDYLKVTTTNRGSGAAMRIGSLALNPAIDDKIVTTLTMITHLHPEAFAGSFAIYRAVTSLIQKPEDFENMVREAVHGAQEGTEIANKAIRSFGLDVPNSNNVGKLIEEVLATNNPYIPIHKEEGWINAKYVVPAAFLVVKNALMSQSMERNLVRTVVENAFSTGGDPDTICSIAMGLIYLFQPKQISLEIRDMIEQYQIEDLESLMQQEDEN